jgi:protein gp37
MEPGHRLHPGVAWLRSLLRQAHRRGFPRNSGHHYEHGFDLLLREERLDLPLTWKQPRRVFVNSMSDLFHAKVPEEFIRRAFATMEEADWHTYQILTKRPQRLARLAGKLPWPPHIWIGVSIESNEFAWRADFLRQVPAAVRFINAEPLLGPVDRIDFDGIHWLITGGESGAGARPCQPQWVRDIRDRCLQAGVAFSHKQWGGLKREEHGRLLDGQIWDQVPEVNAQVARRVFARPGQMRLF